MNQELTVNHPVRRKNWQDRLINTGIGLVLLALSGWLEWRLLDGTLSYYLHPRFNLLIALTGLILTFMGGWLIYRQITAPSYNQIVSAKVVLPVALLALAGLVVTPHPLTSSNGLTTNSGVNRTMTEAVQKQDWSAPGKLDTTTWNLLDWSGALNNPQRAALLVGQTVDVTGFVVLPANRDGRSFLLARYVVVCCTADSTALKLPAFTTKNTELENGQWVRLQGVVAQGPTGNFWFSATSLDPVAQPAQPYIYP